MFKKAPTIWTVDGLCKSAQTNQFEYIISTPTLYREEWLPVRPLGLDTLSSRFKAAWLVFTGRADAVKWPGEQ